MKLIGLLTTALLLGGAPAFQARADASGAATARQKHAADQTFTGEITRNPDNRNLEDQFVLYDQSQMTNYFIAGSEDLSKYVNKTVEVKGSLDQGNQTIHPDSIHVVDTNR